MDQAKSEVLRYLGHRNQPVPADLDHMVGECLTLMRSVTPRQISLTFGLLPTDSGISLSGTDILLQGKDIARHLRGSSQAVLMAATLGAEADMLIRKWERTDLTRSLVLDACATQLIEEYCDDIEQTVRAKAAASGLLATRRFSPGYGDLSLDIQPQIVGTLDAGRKIGLTCTESLILLPRKSVTALIGLGETLSLSPGGCSGCSMRGACNFRKDGNAHECPGMVKE